MKSGKSKKRSDRKESPKRKKTEKDRGRSVKTKKWDEFRVPLFVSTAIILGTIILLYISFKGGEMVKRAELRDRCFMRLKGDGDLARELVSYHLEKGVYPENLELMKEFLKEVESASINIQMAKIYGIEKGLYDTWKFFYCPSDEKDYSNIYTYQRPDDSARDDFIVIRCGVHPDHCITLGDLRKTESSLVKSGNKTNH